MTVGYGICVLISALVAIYVAQRGYRGTDGNFWSVIVLVPVITLGYWFEALSGTGEGALIALCFIELGATILLATALFSLLRDIGVQARLWARGVVLGAVCAEMLVVWLLIREGSDVGMAQVVGAGGSLLDALRGPLRFVRCGYLLGVAVAVAGVVALVRSRKRTYSRLMPAICAGLAGAGVVAYSIEPLFARGFSALPFLYALASVVIAANYDRMHAHDVSNLVSGQQKRRTAWGYVAVGLDGKFLSCDERALEFLPELNAQRVDTVFPESTRAGGLVHRLIGDFEASGAATTRFSSGDMICACEVSGFSMRQDDSIQGYLIGIRDATQEQHALDILSDYNDTLNREVAAKTAHIEQIQRKVVLGMANMVENRDSNTGGHVKRTSDIVQILVDEIEVQGFIGLDDVLAHDIVRAAPMHDLGKISIDSSILNKPGPLTAEEREIMKTHSATSGEMVMILLEGVEEEHFVKAAFNVARYHHERWDGLGYPEGLVGEMIPLEARIMAVADVYDALVSKRSYKESIGFEAVSEMMCAGMGTQFDPNMRTVFLACRDKLESYYAALSQSGESDRKPPTKRP